MCGRCPALEGARHTSPQWAPDGRSVFFVADPDGIANLFRVDLADGGIRQVTDLFTGVSGITETSPALSVAQKSGRIVYSVFRANGYELYSIVEPRDPGWPALYSGRRWPGRRRAAAARSAATRCW